MTPLSEYTFRPCRTRDELATCVAIQKVIWGYAESEVYPLRLFINLTKIGGHVLGAFTPSNVLVGFVASMPAWHGRKRYFHSLSLGVLAAHENRGLGRALKLAQREESLRAGVDCIEWTFDPLKPKNSYFNLIRLGAIVRRYLPDHYGPVQSRLQPGLPSDRLVAEWWLNSPRVKRALAGKPPRSAPKKHARCVEIPMDIGRLAEESPGEAKAIQQRVREELLEAFARKLAITGFERDGRAYRFLLEKYEN
ncbi:MAG TPA: acetyltransferase [Terriglobia bacterium]|nr:acetyltransferase [Terriglobia bacterium]